MKNLIRRTAASSPPPSSSSSLAPLPSGFIELLGRTNFSFLQGASHPEEMISQAIASGYRGIGICDLNGLYGVVRGYEMITKPSLFTASAEPPENFKYLIGSEISTVEGVHITLMPKNKRGYGHLCALLTLGKRNAEKGFSKISLQDLLEHSDECLAFFLPPWKPDLLETCRRHFGDRLYLPVWRDLSWTSLEFCNEAFDLERQGYQLFATQRPFMHARDRKPLFDVLTCLLHKTTFDEAAGLFVSNGERCLHPLAELARLWKDRPDLLERTLEIASRVNFSFSEIRYRYPAGFLPFGMTASQYLRHLVEEGIPWRFPNGIEDDYRQRIDHELSIIQDLGYEDYFLTLFEICEFAKAKKIFYQGRGSAANSLVCYCLGLTSVHPKQVDLLFERFISKERGEPPDIDIDFEHERREEVIQHIYERYGPLHSAMVCNVVRFRSRMAFREVAKTLGISPEKIGQVVSYMGRDGLKRLVGNQALADQFQIHAGRWEKLLQLASQIHGFPRHLSIHSGGFVITQDPLTEIGPVEKATMEGRYVIQWNKDDVNALGLMKIDLLSLGMLSCLRKSFHLLKEKKGIDMNLATVPQNDAPTYEMIGKADTIGVFQIESRAQMATLPRMKPANFYDIVIEVALVRPGPLQGGMVHPFLRRRQGLEKVTYPHESLIPILKRTAGIPLFQEQVMKIAIVAAGFTPGEADELRRMMTSAWQKPGIMAGVHAKIVNGMRERGYPEGFARQIYKTIEGFSSYGFPESHSASFALLTYASSYLKCHHPEVFTCSLLNSQPMGFYSSRALIADAQRHGVEVRDVDLQRSFLDCTLEEAPSPRKPLRLGFNQIYGFSDFWAETVVSEREKNGPYQDLSALIKRTGLPKKAVLKLAQANALRSFSVQVRPLLWEIEAMEFDEAHFRFGESLAEPDNEDALYLREEPEWNRMLREYRHKGLSVDLHPLSVLRAGIRSLAEKQKEKGYVSFSTSKQIPALSHQDKVRVAGYAALTQRPPTAKGFCFITLEDEFGSFNIVIPPDVYQKDRLTIYSERLLEIRGRLERVSGVLNIRAERLLPLGVSSTPISIKKADRSPVY